MGMDAFSQGIKGIDITIRDRSLERLYSVLFTYCCLYEDYNFTIFRKPKYYELCFQGESLRGGS